MIVNARGRSVPYWTLHLDGGELNRLRRQAPAAVNLAREPQLEGSSSIAPVVQDRAAKNFIVDYCATFVPPGNAGARSLTRVERARWLGCVQAPHLCIDWLAAQKLTQDGAVSWDLKHRGGSHSVAAPIRSECVFRCTALVSNAPSCLQKCRDRGAGGLLIHPSPQGVSNSVMGRYHLQSLGVACAGLGDVAWQRDRAIKREVLAFIAVSSSQPAMHS